MLHTNIQPLQRNKENLEVSLNNLNFDFDVIALSETWHAGSNLGNQTRHSVTI